MMAHFAEIKNNKVVRVLAVDNSKLLDEHGQEQESIGITFLKSIFGDNTEWIQTSYNERIRSNYAGIGYDYDEKKDAFIAPKPKHKAKTIEGIELTGEWVLNDKNKWEFRIFI